MERLLWALPALACPIGMGLMMWMMMRPGQKQPADASATSARQDELAQLRSEIAALRQAQAAPDLTKSVSAEPGSRAR
jgi:hypothetical protein